MASKGSDLAQRSADGTKTVRFDISNPHGMKSHLITLDERALKLKNSGHLAEAAELFDTIVKEQPDWEHGTAFYNLANCYEDLGKLALAERAYRDALRYEPKNPYFLGGLASFLYLHGDPQEAFESYLNLLEVEQASDNKEGIEDANAGLQTLARKLGLSEEALAKRIRPKQEKGRKQGA